MIMCPECGAERQNAATCEEDFHQMLFWESENLAELGVVHHLMVLSYYLQHPSLYSPEGLAAGQELLADFVVRGLPPAEVRQRDRAARDSQNRPYPITSRPDARGSYDRPMRWTMRAADVGAGGPEHYCANVRAWAQSIYAALHAGD